MKRKSRIKSKKLSPRTSTPGKIFQRISLCKSFDFSKGVIGFAKIAFSLERLYWMIIRTKSGRTFFAGFFQVSLFFWDQGENTPGKNFPETQSIKIEFKSGEIPVLNNLGKIIWNVDSCSLTPKSAKLACHQMLKIINTVKDLKISKKKFNRYSGQVGSRTSWKNISTVWIVGQFDMGELGCGTSFFQYFGSSTFSHKYDAGAATKVHVNGSIDACKYTEIFRNILRSRVSKGWESKWLKLFTKANMK